MVIEPTADADVQVSGSNPARPNAGASAKLPSGNRIADLPISGRLHYHSTGACFDRTYSPLCLKPSDQKILTPPPPKSVIQFQGIKASESKNPLGDCLIGQNNDFTRGGTSNTMPWGMLRE